MISPLQVKKRQGFKHLLLLCKIVLEKERHWGPAGPQHLHNNAPRECEGESVREAASFTVLVAHYGAKAVVGDSGDQTALVKLSSLPHTCRKGRKTVTFTYGCNYYSN